MVLCRVGALGTTKQPRSHSWHLSLIDSGHWGLGVYIWGCDGPCGLEVCGWYVGIFLVAGLDCKSLPGTWKWGSGNVLFCVLSMYGGSRGGEDPNEYSQIGLLFSKLGIR